MERRAFIRLVALAAGFATTRGGLLDPRRALAATVRVRGDRGWLLGYPGGCAGTRRRRTGLGDIV